MEIGVDSSAGRWRRSGRTDEMPLMPKGRYRLMNDYMESEVGTMGRAMMRRTCTVQVNIDFGSEAEAWWQKLRVALALQPVATATVCEFSVLRG